MCSLCQVAGHRAKPSTKIVTLNPPESPHFTDEETEAERAGRLSAGGKSFIGLTLHSSSSWSPKLAKFDKWVARSQGRKHL